MRGKALDERASKWLRRWPAWDTMIYSGHGFRGTRFCAWRSGVPGIPDDKFRDGIKVVADVADSDPVVAVGSAVQRDWLCVVFETPDGDVFAVNDMFVTMFAGFELRVCRWFDPVLLVAVDASGVVQGMVAPVVVQ